MNELIQEALALPNLPLTLLLGVILAYWLFVLIGGLDLDVFDIGGDVDVGADVSDVSSHPSGAALGGLVFNAGRLLGISQVPLAIWASFFVLFIWAGALILNYRFNGEAGDRDLTRAAFLLLPNLAGSFVLTRLATWPVAKIFGAFSQVSDESSQIEGRLGVVLTTELTDTFGQVQVDPSHGAPALVMARLTKPGPALGKGDRVRVIKASPDRSLYFVEPQPPETHP